MDISSIFLFIKQYGVPLVFLIALLYWLKPKADEAWDVIISKARGTPSLNPHSGFDEMLQVDLDMNGVITEVLHETSSDYVSIWQFHNGAISLGGIPFLRISVTHQQIRSGLLGWGHMYQNLPTSLFVACRSFKSMINEFRSAVVMCDDYEGNETIVGILSAHDIKSMQVCPIRDSRDRLIALLTLSFVDEKSMALVKSEVLFGYTTRICILLELQARLSKEAK